MRKILQWIGAAAIAAALAVCSYGAGLQRGQNSPTTGTEIQTDTLYLPDTITVSNPPKITSTKIDTIYLHLPPSTDTVYLPLPKEQVHYGDSLYDVWVSGVQPSLDSLKVYPRTVIVTATRREPAPRWSFGVTAGVGVVVSPVTGAVTAGPGVAVGVSYRF